MKSLWQARRESESGYYSSLLSLSLSLSLSLMQSGGPTYFRVVLELV